MCAKKFLRKVEEDEEDKEATGGAAAPPALTSKQLIALIGKNIREMIKLGSIFGLGLAAPLPGSSTISSTKPEYSYHVNKSWRPRDYDTSPLLCLSLEEGVPLRAFVRYVVDLLQELSDK